MHSKSKGKIAELKVSAHLIGLGWTVLSPLCETTRYDLAAEKGGKFIRIQVKYVTPTNGILHVNCKSSNNWSVLAYTPEEIDVLSVFDSVSHKIYFISASELNASSIKLRIDPTKNKQQKKIKFAQNFEILKV